MSAVEKTRQELRALRFLGIEAAFLALPLVILLVGNAELALAVALFYSFAIAFVVFSLKPNLLLYLLAVVFIFLAFLPQVVIIVSFLEVFVFFILFFSLTNHVRPPPSRLNISLSGIKTPMILFLAALLVSVVYSSLQGWFSTFLVEQTMTILEGVVVCACVIGVITKTKDLQRLLHCLIVAALVLVAIVLGSSFSLEFPAVLFMKRPTFLGASLDFNIIAMVIGPYVLVALSMLSSTESNAHKAFLATFIVLACLALVFTKSRGAWFGLVVALILFLFKTKRLGFIAVFAPVVALLFLTSLGRLLGFRVAQTSLSDPAMVERFFIWRSAAGVVVDHGLFGIGMDNFRFIKFTYGFPSILDFFSAKSTHNLFLEVLVDFGILGLVAFTWILVSCFKNVIQAYRNATSRHLKTLSLGLACALVEFIAHGLFDCGLANPVVLLAFFFLVGLSISVAKVTANGQI